MIMKTNTRHTELNNRHAELVSASLINKTPNQVRGDRHLSKFRMTIFCFFLITTRLFASPATSVQEYTLENGMQVFLLEDSSDARVHIEFTCRAGFSSQTQSTNGFFKLFTRLVKAATPSLNFTDVQCNADSSRYFLDISPSQTEDALFTLSDAVFSLDFSDEMISKEFSDLKKEVSDNANTMSTLINAAIDSRVFSGAPWQHDSGIYPPVFKKTSEKTARTILKQIGEQWYTPKNCAIFISGNINTERTLIWLRNSFGRFYSSFRTPQEKPAAPVNRQRKYVLHSNEISGNLTQLVIQYTMLDMEQSDLLALTLGYEGSLFKQLLLGFEELNIPGDEYINVSAAHKKDSSRLIIQTLLQPPEDKKAAAKTNSFKQAELFLSQLSLIPEVVRPEEFEYAKNQLEYSLNRTAAVPQKLMENLSSFWALQPYLQPDFQINLQPQENPSEEYASPTTELMMNRSQKLRKNTLTESLAQLESEQPFIFILINSKDYKANKKAYTAAGFEEINEKNASWYVQEMFKEMREEAAPQTNQLFTILSNTSDNNYYQKNKNSISQSELSNGIKVYSKQNSLSHQTSLVLSIKGGKYNSNDDNGFEEVMINLLAGMIQKKLFAGQEEGLITGAPYVTSRTDLFSSQIIIEFDTEDTLAACRIIADAIIFGEIAPADADRAVSARKYRKRLENGTAANQMYGKLIENLYGAGGLANIYEAENEILSDTDYTKILAAYPALLDASRYSVIAVGNVDTNLTQILEKTLGLLTQTNLPGAGDGLNSSDGLSSPDQQMAAYEPSSPDGQSSPDEQSSSALPATPAQIRDLYVTVRHTFLTDIPAEKAGPQPAVLIPTTEFLDPVIYGGKAPPQGTKEAALYNAVLSYLGTLIGENYAVSVQLPKAGLELGTLTVQNVARTRELDSQYKSAVQKIEEELGKLQANENIVRAIKDNWIQKEMYETGSNTGTALLMQKGFELTPDKAALWYLEEYNYIQNATAQDFLEILEYFPVRAQFRVYSSDSKK